MEERKDSKSILVVDDSVLIRLMAKNILGQKDMTLKLQLLLKKQY
jgi:CheY-like chemotaxis protein